MRMPRTTLWLVLGLVAVLGCQSQAPTFTPQDEATIRAELDSALVAITDGNWTAWADIFADDAVLQPPHAPTVSGRAALEDWGKQALIVQSMTWPNASVHGDGDMAWVTTDYQLQLKDGTPDQGKQLAVYHRQADGTWKVVAVSFSSDLPIPTPMAQ